MKHIWKNYYNAIVWCGSPYIIAEEPIICLRMDNIMDRQNKNVCKKCLQAILCTTKIMLREK
jgi:hypothetical protein